MSTQIWTTRYPTNLDTASQQPVVVNDVDDIDASHVNTLASASQAIQAKVGTNNLESGSLLEHMGISNAYMSQTPLPKLVWQTTSSITVEDVDGVTQSKVALSDGKVRTLASGLSVALTNPNGPHGIDTGSPVVDRWYRNYLIPDPSDDDLLSVVSSLNAPATGPTGYSVNKYIGSMYRNGGGVLIEFDQTGPRFFIRRTDQRKTLLLWNDVTPPVVGSWVTIDAEGVYDIPPEICSSFTMTGGIDGDSGFCQISVTTDDGVPSYSPSGGSHGDVFLRFQGNMQESNTRDFPNIDGNVYYWVHAGVTDVVDMQLQLQAWEDKYLLEPVTTVSNPTLGEHAIGGPIHTASTLAELNTKISDATLDSISDTRTPSTHAIAGAQHGTSTFAQLNAKISNATLVESSDSRLIDERTPSVHAIGGVRHGSSTFAEINALVSNANLVDSTDYRLSDSRSPTSHGSSHESGSSDPFSVDGLSGVLTDKQDADKLQGRDISASAPAGGQTLVWNSGSSVWEPGAGGGGGGSSVWTGLTDTPSTFTGNARKLSYANPGETAIEFLDMVVSEDGTPKVNTPIAFDFIGASVVDDSYTAQITIPYDGLTVTKKLLAADFNTSSPHTDWQDVDNGGGDAASVTFTAVEGETVKATFSATWRENGADTSEIMRMRFVLDSSEELASTQAYWVGSNNSADQAMLVYYFENLTAGSHTIKVQIKSADKQVQLDADPGGTEDIAKLWVEQNRGGYERRDNLSSVHSTGFTAEVGINRVNISSDFTATLPPAADAINQVVKLLVTANNPLYELTVTGDGSETIDGVASVYLQAVGCSEFYSDGTSWYWLKKGMVYIDRGSRSSSDWDEGDLTEDFAWRSLSLTSVIPNAAKNNPVEFEISHSGTVNTSLSLSSGTTTTEQNMLYTKSHVSSVLGRAAGQVTCTATGAVYYRVSAGTHDITVRGWWVHV